MSLLTRGRAKTFTGEPTPRFDTDSYNPYADFRLSRQIEPKTNWRDTVETILATLSALGWGLLIIFVFSIGIFADISAVLFISGNVLLIIVSVAKSTVGDTWLIGSPIELLFI